ncbi:MAG: DUF4270 domain-containing protein [Prevotella sp.]|nr:DUF4270 domain-containing protein [Prevotella sp.]MDE7455412.1 DUF4270 domain-containing protein [Prevotella sp.]
MMRKLIMAAIALITVAITSCSEDTNRLGNTLTSPVDKFTVTTDTFDVATRSIKADSVLSRSAYSYIGRLKDPETGSYITCDYMTQFHILENQASKLFPDKETLAAQGAVFSAQADSCFISIIINGYQGDSLAAMKLNIRELAKPVEESRTYYTNFDPAAKGYLRTDAGAINQSMVYSMTDLTLSDSLRNVYRKNGYYMNVRIPLNNDYTDKNGKLYSAEEGGYGTYLMQTFYEHPEYFKNAKTFTRNVCPGFYITCTDGLGVITEVAYTQLTTYFHQTLKDTTYVGNVSLNATEEVLQTTHITNNKENINKLVADNECTYLKTPAGIYTEVTMPVEDIKRGHENDTITSARITFSRMNDKSNLSDMVLEEPTNLLMVEADSLYTFFENNRVPDNKTSYLATYNSTYKTYTFNNLSTLINHLWARRNQSPNWNKVVLIPVQVESTSSTVSAVSNEMNVNSIRLVGGSQNKHTPVRISVIYNKNDED